MFRRFYDEVRNGNDRHTSGKEDPCVRLRPDMLKRDGNGNKHEKPIDRHFTFPPNGADEMDQRPLCCRSTFDASVDAASMRNARGDPARTNSSSYQLPPTEEKLIDQFRSFLAIPLLEPGRHDRQSMPIVFAQQHCLVLKSAGAELHAGIVADRGEISNGSEVRQANLTVGRIQT